eukprot:m.24391 g.24391  ORF g.24391 m.24391 type:complete len:50 (-) comp5642_c0_seq2:43-192(-)
MQKPPWVGLEGGLVWLGWWVGSVFTTLTAIENQQLKYFTFLYDLTRTEN